MQVEKADGEKALLCDEFDWDLADPKNSPENFAQVLCADLGLNFRNVRPIARAIRTELLHFETMPMETKPPLPVLQSGIRTATEEDLRNFRRKAVETAKEIVEGLLDDSFERYIFEQDIQEEVDERFMEEEEERVVNQWTKLKTKAKGIQSDVIPETRTTSAGRLLSRLADT